MIDAIKEYWTAITGLIALVVWLVRIEARTNSNAREATENRREIEKLEHRIDTKLDAMTAQSAKDMARIERRSTEDSERIWKILDEMRADIKSLLSSKAKG